MTNSAAIAQAVIRAQHGAREVVRTLQLLILWRTLAPKCARPDDFENYYTRLWTGNKELREALNESLPVVTKAAADNQLPEFHACGQRGATAHETVVELAWVIGLCLVGARRSRATPNGGAVLLPPSDVDRDGICEVLGILDDEDLKAIDSRVRQECSLALHELNPPRRTGAWSVEKPSDPEYAAEADADSSTRTMTLKSAQRTTRQFIALLRLFRSWAEQPARAGSHENFKSLWFSFHPAVSELQKDLEIAVPYVTKAVTNHGMTEVVACGRRGSTAHETVREVGESIAISLFLALGPTQHLSIENEDSVRKALRLPSATELDILDSRVRQECNLALADADHCAADDPAVNDEGQDVGMNSDASEAPAELEQLAAFVPALDDSLEEWVSNKDAARILGIKTRTLATRRSQGQRSSCGSYGMHDGRCFWRKVGRQHPWYYLPLLENQTGHLAKTDSLDTTISPENRP